MLIFLSSYFDLHRRLKKKKQKQTFPFQGDQKKQVNKTTWDAVLNSEEIVAHYKLSS